MAPNRCIEFLPTERTDELFSACALACLPACLR